ncbi:MAG: tRNA nucleotidyltransferase, partial [Deltaproteobacteria bacterium]|nr:tRNA nucleotidyltransferase [Deltaproteobacteria bacterium]
EDYLAPVGGARAPRKPLLGGQDIIAALQISPGPDVGRILKNLVRAHDLGVVGTPEEALDWLRLLGGGEGGRDR